MDAVAAVFSRDPSKVYFDAVYNAARSVVSQHLLSDVNAKLKQEFCRRLASIDAHSVADVLPFWTTFQAEVKQIEAFWKYVGLKPVEDQERDLSLAKNAEVRKAHLHRCTAMAIEAWNSQVHARAQGMLRAEMESVLMRVIRQGGQLSGKDQELFDYMRVMGQDFLRPAVRLFAEDFEACQARLTDSEKMSHLIRGTQKMAAFFHNEDLQDQTVLPYLEPIISSLCVQRDFESLNRLKRFLSRSLTGVYSDAILRHFATVAIPDDFFEMSTILRDYSSILLNDAPVKRAVSNKIVHRDFQFPDKFVAVLMSNWDTPGRLKPLASIVPLYDDQGAISTELVRAFLLRMLQKRHSSTEKEEQFCDALLTIFSIEHLRGVRSLLRDYTTSGNLIVINTSLSMPLLANDSVAFPDDLIGPATGELEVYGRPFVSRRFRLSASFSVAYVRAVWPANEERNLVVSVLQYRLLQMVTRRQFDFGKLGASTDCATAALRALIKGSIIAKNGASYEIAARPPKDKRINVYNAAINFRNVEHSSPVKDERDHALGIQSVVAREIKAARKMLVDELEEKVISELSVKFPVTPAEFRDVIKNMIQSEFLEPDERDTRYLVYVS
jgi:hypothetical protein